MSPQGAFFKTPVGLFGAPWLAHWKEREALLGEGAASESHQACCKCRFLPRPPPPASLLGSNSAPRVALD